MNKDIFKGNWEQAKGKMKTQWGKLTDDDFKKIEGKSQELSGRIQERYGIAKDEADKQTSTFFATL